MKSLKTPANHISSKNNINNLSFTKKILSRKHSVMERNRSNRKIVISKMQSPKATIDTGEYFPNDEIPISKENKYTRSAKAIGNLGTPKKTPELLSKSKKPFIFHIKISSKISFISIAFP